MVVSTHFQQPVFATTSLRTMVNIPDGQTVLLVGMKAVKERREERSILTISDDPEEDQLAMNAALNLLPYSGLTRPIFAVSPAVHGLKRVTCYRETLDFVIMVTPHRDSGGTVTWCHFISGTLMAGTQVCVPNLHRKSVGRARRAGACESHRWRPDRASCRPCRSTSRRTE